MIGFLRRWRFLLLLIALVLSLVLEPLILGLREQGWFFDLLHSVTVLAAMGSITGYHLGRRYGVLILGIATLATTWVVYLFAGNAVAVSLLVSESFNITFLVFAVWAVVRAVTCQRSMSPDSVFGAIAGYLLLGLAWSNVFMMLHTVAPASFAYNDQVAAQVRESGSRSPLFTYYSFVTLSTLGYGDMTPVSHAARTLSWVEAVSGQFYIAVLVAGLVSVLVSSSQSRSGQMAAEDTESQSDGT